MEQAGIRCHVLPANKVAKKRTDRIKTDKRDARLIGRELRSKSRGSRPAPAAQEIQTAGVQGQAREHGRDCRGPGACGIYLGGPGIRCGVGTGVYGGRTSEQDGKPGRVWEILDGA